MNEYVGMSVAILGSGAQGSVIAYFLSKGFSFSEIRLGDINQLKAEKVRRWIGGNITTSKVDAGKVDEVKNFIKGCDVVVNAVEPRFNLSILEASYLAGVNYQDLAFGPPYENLRHQLAYDSKFRENSLIALTATGFSPGLSNALVGFTMGKYGELRSIKLRVYGVLEGRRAYLTWSPLTMLEDTMLKPLIFRKGVYEELEHFSESETYTFPEPVGPKTVYPRIHEEIFTFPKFVNGLEYVDIKFGGRGIELLKDLYYLGFLSEDTIEVEGWKIRRIDLTALMLPKPPEPEEVAKLLNEDPNVESYGFYVVETVTKKDQKITYTIPFLDIRTIQSIIPGVTHVSYQTSIPAAIFTAMIVKNEIKERGVLPPECINTETLMKYLKKVGENGIKITQHIEEIIN